MKQTINLLFIVCLLFSGISCKKTETSPSKIVLKTKPLDVAQLKSISNVLKSKEATISQNNNSERNVRRLTKLDDQELHSIIEPLVINGRELQTELLTIISNSTEWQQLPESQQLEIINLSDEQLADLALTYGAVTYGSVGDAIKDCVSTALGIRGIQHLAKSLVTGPSVSTAIGILKWIGGRYLSYIGVAWMIWDFVDCMSHFG
jgi:hypothetical protein